MYKNLFFDFDGTLFNGYPRMLSAMQKTFSAKRNLEVSYDSLFKDCMESFKYLGDKYQITKEEWDYYSSLCDNDPSLPEFCPFEGAENLLKELVAKGIKCYIYTNRNEATYDYLKKYNLYDYFEDFILDAHKPDPKPLLDMIEKHHLRKEECLVIGDRTLDIESANNALIDSFAINDYKPELNATYQGEDFNELKKIVFLKPIKGIVFDMDGVLISTDQLHNIAWGHIAMDEGIYFDENIGNELRGISRKSSLEVILRGRKREYTDIEKQELLDRKGMYYKEILDKLDHSFVPEVTLKCLHDLKAIGIRIAIGSSSLNGKYISNRLDFAKEFEAVIDGTMIEKPKPNPEVFLKACAALNLDPSECLIIEDATAGIEAGNRGGFISVGMSYVKEFNKTNIKIDGLDDLVDVVNKLNSVAR